MVPGTNRGHCPAEWDELRYLYLAPEEAAVPLSGMSVAMVPGTKAGNGARHRVAEIGRRSLIRDRDIALEDGLPFIG